VQGWCVYHAHQALSVASWRTSDLFGPPARGATSGGHPSWRARGAMTTLDRALSRQVIHRPLRRELEQSSTRKSRCSGQELRSSSQRRGKVDTTRRRQLFERLLRGPTSRRRRTTRCRSQPMIDFGWLVGTDFSPTNSRSYSEHSVEARYKSTSGVRPRISRWGRSSEPTPP